MSLDVLRGLFILLMNVGFAMPGGLFPDWMYHRQFPASNDLKFLEIAGLTWRDMTLGGFLFTMAAAIPVTMTIRLDRGTKTRELVLIALRRAFLLFVFALVIGHTSPYWTNQYTPLGNAIAAVGWTLCFLIFTRRRSDWNKRLFVSLQAIGWTGVVVLFVLSEKLSGQPFAFSRRDDILALLAFAAVAGIGIWLLTRTSPPARLAILAALVALRLASTDPGWVQQLWSFSPAPWLFYWGTLDLLLIIIPGTIVGDALVAWIKTPHAIPADHVWRPWQLWTVAGLSVAIEPLLVVGLYLRQTLATTIAVAAVAAAIFALTRRPGSAGERVVARILAWGIFWILLGLLLEPFEGGVKKVPGTLSYYFMTGGNAMCLLGALITLFDLIGAGRKPARIVADVGENPLAGYMIMPLFVAPLLILVPSFAPQAATPIGALVRAALSVVIVAGLVGFMTRKRIFWRT